MDIGDRINRHKNEDPRNGQTEYRNNVPCSPQYSNVTLPEDRLPPRWDNCTLTHPLENENFAKHRMDKRHDDSDQSTD